MGKCLPCMYKAGDSISTTTKTKPINQTTKHEDVIIKHEFNDMNRGLAESRIFIKILIYICQTLIERCPITDYFKRQYNVIHAPYHQHFQQFSLYYQLAAHFKYFQFEYDKQVKYIHVQHEV